MTVTTVSKGRGGRRSRELGRLGLAIIAAIGMVSGCDLGGDGERLLHISGDPAYVAADGASCIRLSIAVEGGSSWERLLPPDLSVNLGRLLHLRRAPEGWRADLCAGAETGRARLWSNHSTIGSQAAFYFVPPEPDRPPGPIAAASFTAIVDPGLQTVDFIGADLADPADLQLAVTLSNSTPFIFDGATVVVFVTVSGTGLPFDLIGLWAELDQIWGPGVTVYPFGHDPANGLPYFDFGGFLATDRAIAEQGGPSQWTMPMIFRAGALDPFAFAGVILAWPPAAQDDAAEFRVRPYLSRLNQDTVTVAWETDREAMSFVAYGPTPACDLVAGGDLVRNQILEHYSPSLIAPPYFDSFFHSVTIAGLEPGRTYYYRVLPVKDPTPAEPFKSPPAPGAPFRFGVIGDTRTGHEWHAKVVAQTQRREPDFVIYPGDFVSDSSLESEWLTFFAIEADLAKNSPIFPTVGNHDTAEMDRFYLRYFGAASISPVPPALEGRVYSFDHGHAHFVSIDSNLGVDPASPTYSWLEADLAAALANPQRKFTFVLLHNPIYSAFSHGQYTAGRTWLAPLLVAYDVDAVFAGHVHLYERDDVSGRVHLTSGGGGAPTYFESPSLALNPYYLVHAYTYQSLIVDVAADSFHVSAIDHDGAVIDQVDYLKP